MAQNDFFEAVTPKDSPSSFLPLAFRMRPRTLDEVVGQEHLLSEGSTLRRAILADRLTSLIFYGPPGSGKTTLAHVISNATQSSFRTLNAVTSNVSEIRRELEIAERILRTQGKRTILFIDEIHRFNKAQQDILMPEVESGSIVLIGATTHNPFFSINGPLLSRSLIFELRPLREEQILILLKKAVRDEERGLGRWKVKVDGPALEFISRNSSGDARRALNVLEIGVLSSKPGDRGEILFDERVARDSMQKRLVFYDHDEDYHYDTASALIKSLRGSDPNAAVYWLAKMLTAGEDPQFITRRLVIFASEDIGNADPQALVVAEACARSVERIGMPESRIILAQAVTYLALAPKSNASYLAIEEAMKDVEAGKIQEVPRHLRDRSYRGAKRLGHGEGYQYPHSFPDHYVEQSYIEIEKEYYRPTDIGFESDLRKRMERLSSKRRENQK